VRRGFGQIKDLNNARLLSYKTYYEPFSDLIKLRTQCDHDFRKTFRALKLLENEKDARSRLADWVQGKNTEPLKNWCQSI
jgi:hypothetical protein